MMRRILTALFLLLLTGVAFAQGGLTEAHNFASTLTPPESDRSVAYLGLVFGTVGNVIQGTSGQILGQMFSVFNKGVMVVAALYLAMTTFQMAMRAAQEGSFMGQNKSVHLVLLRIAFGFALIIPSASTGYSLLQDFFMKVVVAGVALADQTWNTALNYMSYGGQLYIPPTAISSENTQKIVTNTIGDRVPTGYPSSSSGGSSGDSSALPTLPLLTQIFQSEVCMLRSGSQAWNGSGAVQYTYDLHMDPVNGIIYFPGLGNQDTDNLNTTNSACGYVQSYCAANEGKCATSSSLPGYTGSLNMANLTPGDSSSNGEMEWNYSWLAMKQLVLSLLPAAQNYVDQYQTFEGNNYAANVYPSTDPAGVVSANAKTFMTALMAYNNLATPLQNLLASGSQPNYAAMGSAGWIGAGGFYWQIEQANNKSNGLSYTALLPTVKAPLPNSLPSSEGVNGLTEMTTVAQEVIGSKQGPYQGYGTEFSTLWAAYTGAANSGAASIISNSSSGGGIIGAIIMGILGSISVPDMLGGAQAYNPIIVLMNEGRQLIETVARMWVGALTVSFITGLVAGICSSVSPGSTALESALTWLKSIFMLLTTVLLAPGVILYYYVPLYPFAVFTFAAIGWVMMVVEGMAAAPLICVGITHPEGHDFLGKSEQALMFFLGIFVRPALLIIGLIASMLVSFVAFQIFISGYAHVMPASISESGLYAVFVDLIEFVMGILIFGMFTMELTEQSYKLIFQLPQYVMKWIGGPEMGQDYAGMAGQVKGAISGGASGLGQAAEPLAQFAKGVGQAPGEIKAFADKMSKKKAEESGSSDVTTSGGGP